LARGGGWVAIFVVTSSVAVACSESAGSGASSASASGAGGGSGGCAATPRPNLLLDVRAAGGALPPDTTIVADWSGGEAGPWVLDDPKTWRPLDESNLVCDVDPQNPPKLPLMQLHCQVWTTGATRIRVSAPGRSPFDRTLAPPVMPCTPPARVTVDLEELDAG
jgi:hypothetical protein